jgi:hypothetical protein
MEGVIETNSEFVFLAPGKLGLRSQRLAGDSRSLDLSGKSVPRMGRSWRTRTALGSHAVNDRLLPALHGLVAAWHEHPVGHQPVFDATDRHPPRHHQTAAQFS